MSKDEQITFRTTPEGYLFVEEKAKKLGLTKSQVIRKMFAYAAKNMKPEDYWNEQ